MFGLYMSSLYNYKLLKPVNFIIIVKLKYITYNNLTKSLLIDNSLQKDLEIAKKRKLLNNNTNNTNKTNKTNKPTKSIEMSESHCSEPLKK